MRIKTGLCGFLGLVAVLGLLGGCAKKTEPRVYFGNLTDGAQVESPFRVQMKAENVVVEPAANGVKEGHGHFLLVIDSPMPSLKTAMRRDSLHRSFAEGEAETELDLPVGEHTLLLLFARGNGTPFEPPVFQQIKINVNKRNGMENDMAIDSLLDSLGMGEGMKPVVADSGPGAGPASGTGSPAPDTAKGAQGGMRSAKDSAGPATRQDKPQ